MIGIDVGVHTGVAVWDPQKQAFLDIQTRKLHQAFKDVEMWKELCTELIVYFEDARLRKWFGNSGPEKWKGAGSVMRDSKIWEDYLEDLHVPYFAVAPKNNSTKMNATYFKAITKYDRVTSEHGRDAAMLVFARR